MAAEHKHPNYMAIFWLLAVLTVVEIVGLYWHFVDLVWIMVFTFMYLL